MKQIAQGAEATVYRDKNIIIKKRLAKSYRIPAIDNRLRTSRTKREAKVLEKLASSGFTPRLFKTDETTLELQYMHGQKLSCCLEKSNGKKIGTIIGKQIRYLHDTGIIHGDLTTSNMIHDQTWTKDKCLQRDRISFIDFGLSFFSEKIEDKAVDLHVLGEALEARHQTVSKTVFSAVKKAYNDTAVLHRLGNVEQRGRNKSKQANKNCE